MKQILNNKIVFTTLDNKYIIKCKCIDKLITIDNHIVYNSNCATYYCNKVIIIEIYDNNKNIIAYPITVSEYKYSLKKHSIIDLKSFKENEKLKKKNYFKTFLRSFLDINKIDNIKYNINTNGEVYGFTNDIVKFDCFMDIFKYKKLDYYTIFYYKGDITHHLYYDCEHVNIIYYLYNKLYKYDVKIYNNKIIITKFLKKRKKNIFYKQIVICNKELKILQLIESNCGKIIYEENRDNNDVIINIKKYNLITDKLEIILSNDNDKSILIKSDKIFFQELLDFYILNVEHDLNKLICIKDNELYNAKKKLLNEIFKNISLV